jgi:hypothetical protein
MRPTIPKTNSGRTGLLSGKAPDLFDKCLTRISAGVPATLIDIIWWFFSDPPGKYRDIVMIKPRTLSPKLFSGHDSLIVYPPILP